MVVRGAWVSGVRYVVWRIKCGERMSRTDRRAAARPEGAHYLVRAETGGGRVPLCWTVTSDIGGMPCWDGGTGVRVGWCVVD
uniref:Uncharacterized protein n=1 Tax=Knipowitschia caucasica TaxID=637954 RepID=A0AAV2L682_KNICA